MAKKPLTCKRMTFASLMDAKTYIHINFAVKGRTRPLVEPCPRCNQYHLRERDEA